MFRGPWALKKRKGTEKNRSPGVWDHFRLPTHPSLPPSPAFLATIESLPMSYLECGSIQRRTSRKDLKNDLIDV
jgi:hypothetical protein